MDTIRMQQYGSSWMYNHQKKVQRWKTDCYTVELGKILKKYIVFCSSFLKTLLLIYPLHFIGLFPNYLIATRPILKLTGHTKIEALCIPTFFKLVTLYLLYRLQLILIYSHISYPFTVFHGQYHLLNKTQITVLNYPKSNCFIIQSQHSWFLPEPSFESSYTVIPATFISEDTNLLSPWTTFIWKQQNIITYLKIPIIIKYSYNTPWLLFIYINWDTYINRNFYGSYCKSGKPNAYYLQPQKWLH